MKNEEILEKVLRRMKGKSYEEIIVALEKEIDYLRNKIKNEIDIDINDLTWFRVDQNTDAEQLFNFLMGYVPMRQVLALYKRIKQEIGE